MPPLRALKLLDIDPLCYADDVPNCLADLQSLRHLNMHFSPRMPAAHEPSVSRYTFFR